MHDSVAQRMAHHAGLTTPVVIVGPAHTPEQIARAIADATTRRWRWEPPAYAVLYLISLILAITTNLTAALLTFGLGAILLVLLGGLHSRHHHRKVAHKTRTLLDATTPRDWH